MFDLISYRALSFDRTPAEAAQKLRATWGVQHGPIHNVTRQIEDAGGVVLRSDFGTRHVDGFSKGPKSSRPIFHMNGDMPPDRWRWTEGGIRLLREANRRHLSRRGGVGFRQGQGRPLRFQWDSTTNVSLYILLGFILR